MTATFLTSQLDSAADRRTPHLVLVGLPGSGKSAIGPGLAERLRRGFLDVDREIERREGTTIAALFAEKGEHYFRAKEVAVTEELKLLGNMVVAPGGGWITNKEVVELLRPPAKLIYLKVRPETALQRLGAEVTTRPLLSRPDPLGELTRLLEERQPLYETADMIVDTEHQTPDKVIDKIVQALARV